MSVKTYKLKLNILPDHPEIRDWLWLSHVKFNEGVQYLLHQLFLLRRGKGWSRRDGTFTPNTELIGRFKAAGKNDKQAEELAEVCRKVYEHIFPKSDADSEDDDISQAGRAQDIARSLYGPLTDPDSTGLGVDSNEKILRALEKAIAKPETVKDPELLRFQDGGRSPRHYTLFLDWQAKGMKAKSQHRVDFINAARKYLESKSDAKETDYRRNIALLRRVLGGKVFGPVRVHLGIWDDENTPSDQGATSEWERGMFTQALERLLTHEGWVFRRKREREKAELKLKYELDGYWENEDEKDKDGKPMRMSMETPPKNQKGWKRVSGARTEPWFIRLREYEIQRTKEDAGASRQGAKEEVRIGGAMLKGWKPIRERLKKAVAKGGLDSVGLTRILNQYQTENPIRFGDGRFFRWLIDAANRFLWEGEEDYVRRFASLKIRRYKRITWTVPDAVKHPLWIRYGDASAVKYTLNPTMDRMTLELLVPHPSQKGAVIRRKVEGIAVAPYEKFLSNFRMLQTEDDKKTRGNKEKRIQASTEMAYDDPFISGRSASLSGGRLMFDRSELGKRGGGLIPTPFFSLSCEIEDVPTSGWEGKWLYSQRLGFEDPLRKEIRKGEPGKRVWPSELMPDGRKPLRLENGARVLSVDLGLRHGAAWAMWGLSTKAKEYPGCPNPRASVEIGVTEDGEVAYAHCLERGLLDLPGEGKDLPQESLDIRERLRNVRTELNINRKLLWIAQKLTETEIVSVEYGSKLAMPRRNGKGFRLKRNIIRNKSVLTNEQQRRGSDDAAEELVQLWEMKELGKWLSEKGWVRPNPDNTDYSAQLAALKEVVWTNRSALVEYIFKPQFVVGGVPKKQRQGVYIENSLFWIRDLRLQKEVATLWKEMRSRQKERGGLSAGRLTFLADFYDLLKAWTFRPRRPGEKRHMAEEQGFAVKDREHLQAVKDDRIKKLSFLILSRTMGYEPNLETGLWRYVDETTGRKLWQRPESGQFYSDEAGKSEIPVPKALDPEEIKRPHRVGPPCQLLVFEDLTRYKFRQDRSRQENSQLMKWSHRELFHFSSQMGQLYGVRTGMVYAAFSSQYCSCCGSAGARVTRIPKEWYPDGQPAQWLQRMAERKDVNGHPTQEATHLKDAKPGDWIAWKSGEWFLCSDGTCPQGKAAVNADENAAANIGRRFLEGIRDFRLTVEMVENGRCVVQRPLSLKGRQLVMDAKNGWTLANEKAVKEVRKRAEPDSQETDEDDEAFRDKRRLLFRNCSAGKRVWFEGGMFWGLARNRVQERLRAGKVKVSQLE